MKYTLMTVLITANLGSTAFSAPVAWADEDKFSLPTVFDYAHVKNDTGSSVTGLLPIPMSGEYENGPWMIKVLVPYTPISGTPNLIPGAVAPGIDSLSSGTAARVPQVGLVDTVAAASYKIYSGKSSTFGIDLTGKIKLNAADASLVSGQNNYAAQADAYQSFNRFTAIGSLGYKFMGNPTGINMNRVIYGSFGGSYQLDDKLNGGVDFSLSQSPSITEEGYRGLTAYVSRKIGKNFKAKGYILKGFSNGTPDSSLGAQVNYGF